METIVDFLLMNANVITLAVAVIAIGGMWYAFSKLKKVGEEVAKAEGKLIDATNSCIVEKQHLKDNINRLNKELVEKDRTLSTVHKNYGDQLSKYKLKVETKSTTVKEQSLRIQRLDAEIGSLKRRIANRDGQITKLKKKLNGLS